MKKTEREGIRESSFLVGFFSTAQEDLDSFLVLYLLFVLHKKPLMICFPLIFSPLPFFSSGAERAFQAIHFRKIFFLLQ